MFSFGSLLKHKRPCRECAERILPDDVPSSGNSDCECVDRTQVVQLCPCGLARAAADSHPGFRRKGNEDSFAYHIDPERDLAILIVADGIGGSSDGDVASNYSVRTLLAAWRKFILRNSPGKNSVASFLRRELERINRSLYEENLIGRRESPMGTTIAVLVLIPGCAVIAHAGDSRVYRCREGALDLLTEDHTLVANMIRTGEISKREAKTHPLSHVIYRSIGPTAHVSPTIRSFDRKCGDRYVVCSDGLTTEVEDSVIRDVMLKARSARESVKRLINEALRQGGVDNVTVLSYYQS